ncbi:MAG: S9 family peptidase [Pseudomonadota bacterium]
MPMTNRFTVALSVATVALLVACGERTNHPAGDSMDTSETSSGAAVAAPFSALNAKPPVADQRPEIIEQHTVKRVDPYSWLRDGNWQEVLQKPEVLRREIRQHLEAENVYYEAATDDLAELREQLFAEMRGRIKEDDSSVPEPDGPFAYATRYREGGEYAIYVRTPRAGGAETVLYDGDVESGNAQFFSIEDVSHSPDHTMVAYGVDRLGSEYYDIRIRNIDSGEEFAETVADTDGSAYWAADSKSFFYVERDDNQRPKRVRRHKLGTDPAQDELIYEEADDSFFLGIGLSQDARYLFISSGQSTTSEVRYLRADAKPGTQPTLVAPRIVDQLYEVEHHGDYFYIHTNAGDALDFKIMRAPVATPGREHWREWVPHRPGTFLIDFVPLQDWIVRFERENALPRIVVSDYDLQETFQIDFPEQAYDLELLNGYEFATDTIRFAYESPSTPTQTYDFNLKTRERELLKTQQVPSGHDPSRYIVERFFVEAADGAEIPVTVLRLKSTAIDASAPMMLYGYGSYGVTIGAWFNTSVLSLVDRGVVYATAHVRGSSAKGRQWYLDGKLKKKMNTFTDFVTAAEVLQERGYGRPGETVIYGGSAGGLLVGAAVNLRPDLFGGVIGAVPFVDVINTISDAELPLTPPEWVEWGNPITDADAYADIAAYSPYDNIRGDVPYPPIMATGGLTDYRVTYWEPAKWVARLRDTAQGGPFVLRMNMGAGHGGSAARFERLMERAHDYAFALKAMGLAKQSLDVVQDSEG